jgi:hypothetical protein
MALLTLTRDIGRIEEQLTDDTMQDTTWARAADNAIRFKKALKQQITNTIADMRRAAKAGLGETKAQALVSQFKADWPAQFEITLSHAREAHPNLWRD